MGTYPKSGTAPLTLRLPPKPTPFSRVSSVALTRPLATATTTTSTSGCLLSPQASCLILLEAQVGCLSREPELASPLLSVSGVGGSLWSVFLYK